MKNHRLFMLWYMIAYIVTFLVIIVTVTNSHIRPSYTSEETESSEEVYTEETSHLETQLVEVEALEIPTSASRFFIESETEVQIIAYISDTVEYETEEVEETTEEFTEVAETDADVYVEEDVYYDLSLSYDMQDVVRYYLDYMNIDLDETYIYAMIYQESQFNPKALGTSGDSGYCQILQRYFGWIYESLIGDYPDLVYLEKDVFNEETNIACGIYYLNYSAEEVSGESLTVNNLTRALTAYNRGVDGAEKLYRNTGSYQSKYSKSVLALANEIQTTGTITE